MTRSKTLIAVAIIAAFAIVGTAGATTHYLITSTKQIKPSVRDALKGERGPRGVAGTDGTPGLQGPAGPAGAPGPAGPVALSRITHVSNTVPIAGNEVQLISVSCPAGQTVVSGGFGVVGTAFISDGVGGTWTVGVDTYGTTSTYNQTAYANCAVSGQAIAARALSRAQISKRYEDLLAARREQHS